MKKTLLALILLCSLLLTGCALPELDLSALPTASPAQAPAEAAHPEAFLVVTVGSAIYEPIPLSGEGRYTVSRGEFVNTIEVTAQSIRMAESSCDNQDCVLQGEVTLENRGDRVLQNMIICLPNEVVLELYTYDEIAELMPGWLEGAEQ